jgi:predicted phage-related endonuclease
MRTVHNIAQGSAEWDDFRWHHHGASESAAMLGLSNKVKRTELLYMKKYGTAREFSEWVQVHILDHGHEVEALARPHVEDFIGDDLYPATYSDEALLSPFCGRQPSASCDGQTMDDSTAWEHKQWSEALAASVAAGVLPEEYMPQCQQVLMVGGAKRLIFTVSDGTPERMRHIEILPDHAWFDRIIAGWEQFEKDLETYEHVEVLPAAVAAPVKDLPALSIRVDGAITTNHNLVLFGAKLQSFIEGINQKPEDDQGFADAEAAIKVMERAETALQAAESSALAQISSVDEMVRTVAMYKELARRTRLMLEKMVKARKETIRVEIQQEVKDKAAAHIKALNVRLGKVYMPHIEADFAGAMKNKRTIASLRDACDTELARFKIEANSIADRIQVNMTVLREVAGGHQFLFADAGQIVLKQTDDFAALVKLRIAEHEAAEAKRQEQLRARIAEEERVKAEAAATEKARLERVAAANLEAESRALAERVERDRVATETKRQLDAKASSIAVQRQVDAAPAPIEIVRVVPTTPPTLRLGNIGERLGFSLTADFLRSLGFEPAARDKAAVLYHEADFGSICAALIRHISAAQSKLAA